MKYTKKDAMIAIVVVAVIGGASFYAGTRAPRKDRLLNANGVQRQGTMARGVRGSMNGFTGGEIIAKDDMSITVKLRDGGSKIIFLTSQTPVMKSAAGSLGDLSIGSSVIATGKGNPDGSITADSIQIRPTSPEPVAR